MLAAIPLGRHQSPAVLCTIGGLARACPRRARRTATAGSGVPRVDAVRARAHKITTPIFMGVIYFVVLTPTVFVMRRFGWKAAACSEGHGRGQAGCRQARELAGTSILTHQFTNSLRRARQWQSQL